MMGNPGLWREWWNMRYGGNGDPVLMDDAACLRFWIGGQP